MTFGGCEREGDRSLNRRSPGAERPDERTLKSSTSKIPTERKDRPIQSGQTDHLRLQVAVKRGTLLRIKKQGYRITGTKKTYVECTSHQPQTTQTRERGFWYYNI
jgi:hypothetical protein